MSGYSDEEVQSAIDQFISSTVEVPLLSTGSRNILHGFSGVQDLVAFALLVRPSSYFYLIWLSANGLQAKLTQQISFIAQIQELGPLASATAKAVTNTTDLFNASAALANLGAALNARSSGSGSGALGPAVARFQASVLSFSRDQLAPNVVSGGQVVQTGPEVRVSLAEAWLQAKALHEQIIASMDLIEAAVTTLSSVRLPETTVAGLVQRFRTRLTEIQTEMSGNDAPKTSRLALLDLITMQSLLTKASSFAAPRLVLAPIPPSDPTTGTLGGGTGTEALLEGTASAPFNYEAGAVLGLSLNGGGSTPSINLPSQSNAAVEASPVFPGPPANIEVRVVVDGATLTFTASSGAWASGSAAAAALDAGLSPRVGVLWTGSSLIFVSTNPADDSSLRFVGGTADRDAFLEWAFRGVAAEAAAAPVPMRDVLDAIASQTSLVNATGTTTSYGSFTGSRTGIGGEESTIWNRIDEGSDLVAAGSTATSPRNLQALGVQAGMALVVTAPTPSTHIILGVGGGTLTLDSAPVAGVLDYYIGPDYRDLPVGARVRVQCASQRINSGYYRVVVGDRAAVTVDPELRVPADDLRVMLFTSLIELGTTVASTTADIEALPGAGADALGLSGSSASSLSMLNTTSGDFLARGVSAGDSIYLVAPSTAQYTRTIETVTMQSVSFESAVPYETGSWTYRIQSTRFEQFGALSTAMTDFRSSTYGDSLAALDQLIGRLIFGGRFAGDVVTALSDYLSALDTALAAVIAYTVDREPLIDNVIRTFREQGYDRALDILLSPDAATFFRLTSDQVSYKTNLIKELGTTARQITPVSKFSKSLTGVPELEVQSSSRVPFNPNSR